MQLEAGTTFILLHEEHGSMTIAVYDDRAGELVIDGTKKLALRSEIFRSIAKSKASGDRTSREM